MAYEIFLQCIQMACGKLDRNYGSSFYVNHVIFRNCSKMDGVVIIGIIGSLLYTHIYLKHRLYALAGLCFYSVLVSFYELYCWKFTKTKNEQQLPLNFVSKSLMIRLILIGMGIWGLSTFLCIFYNIIILGYIFWKKQALKEA